MLVSSTRSERRLSLLVSFVFLRDGVTLWVKCVFHSPLILIEGLLLLLVSVPSGWGPGSGAFACPLFLGWASSFASVLLFSLLCGFLLLCGFPSLGIFSCLALLDFSPPFLLLTSFVIVARCVLCPSLPLVFHFAVLGSSPVAWWPSVLFWPCFLLFSGLEVTFSCLGFSAPRVRVSRWSSGGFSFVRHCFPFFL